MLAVRIDIMFGCAFAKVSITSNCNVHLPLYYIIIIIKFDRVYCLFSFKMSKIVFNGGIFHEPF